MFALRRAVGAVALVVGPSLVQGWKQVKPKWSFLGPDCQGDTCNCTDFALVEHDLKNGTEIPSQDSSFDEVFNEGIRAVRYWPEPIGYKDAFENNDRDPYSFSYEAFHGRDLPMIRNELGANTLLLGAWGLEDASHTNFLETALDNKLKVIPSFDISWYWKKGNWQEPETRIALKTEFLAFMKNTADRTGTSKPFTPDTVLMWNVVGLPELDYLLPRSCALGAKFDMGVFKGCFSTDVISYDAVASISEVQDILEIIRMEQNKFFCNEGPETPEACGRPDDEAGLFTFDRPLALTVELGADFALAFGGNSDYLAALIFWFERVLGCRPLLPGQVSVPLLFEEMTGYCRFHGYGLFDVWIVKMVSASSDVDAAAIKKLIEAFSKPTQVRLPEGGMPVLENVTGATKPVIFEYGFPAYASGVLNATKQHDLLRQVWSGSEEDVNVTSVRNAWKDGYCVKGAVVDEWVDVWSAPDIYEEECPEEPGSQYRHSACGPSTVSGPVAVGYLGLLGQFNTPLGHCLDNRVNESKRFTFLSDEELNRKKEENGYVTPELCHFVRLRPGMPTGVFYFMIFLIPFITFVSLICCAKRWCCQCCKESKPQKDHSSSDHNLSMAARSITSEISAAPFGKQLAIMVAKALKNGNVEVPLKYAHLVGYSGWGLAFYGGKYHYHRLQHDGRGRGASVQAWETDEEFVKWLQQQSDRTMAVYGFSDNELRRSDVVGKKTVTRKQLLETLEAHGEFTDTEGKKQEGLGEARLQCLGRHLKFRVKLSYKGCPAFLSGVIEDEPQLGDSKEDWLKTVAAHVKRFLALMASSHLQVQGDRLRRQLEHEAEAIRADDKLQADLASGEDAAAAPSADESSVQKRACYNIWRRALEGVHHLKQAQDGEAPADYDEDGSWDVFDGYFAEACLLRFLESLGEHLVHAPEWMAMVFQEAKKTLNLEPAPGDAIRGVSCAVDYNLLCEPLQIYTGNSNPFTQKQGINFDDINDTGMLAQAPIEPEQITKVTKTFREPIGLNVLFNIVVNYQWPFAVVWFFFSIAIAARDTQAHAQIQATVGSSGHEKVSWFLVLVIDLIWLSALNLCQLWVDTPYTMEGGSRPCYVFPRFFSCVSLLYLLPLMAAALWVEFEFDISEILPVPVPFLSTANIEEMITMSAKDIKDQFWFAPLAWVFLRLVYGLKPRCNWFLLKGNKLCSSAQLKIIFFWVAFGSVCFMSYYAVLIGMVRMLTANNYCQLNESDEEFCKTRELTFYGVGPVPVKGAQCVACITGVACVWILTLSGSLLMPFFVFNCCVAFVGSSLGVARGLVERKLSSLDLSVQFLSRDFADNCKAEADRATHGTVLKAIYGQEWQKVWEVMVDGLFNDCLIDGEVKKKLLNAAKTGGTFELADKPSGRILPHAIQRLGYLFKSLRAILGDTEFTFTPFDYYAKRCDALGNVHPGHIPSLTQIIPVYSEDGIMSIQELLSTSGVASTLEFLISQFPDEWAIFAKATDLHPSEIYEMLVKGKCNLDQQIQVREWASHRAQSVIRTVNGAVFYHKALQVLLSQGERVSFDDIRRRSQLIMAHQTYGKLSMNRPTKAFLKKGKLIMQEGTHKLTAGDKVRLTLEALDTWDLSVATKIKVAASKFHKHRTSGAAPELIGHSSEDPSARDPSKDGTGMGDFRNGAFYTVKSVEDDKSVVLDDTFTSVGLVMLETIKVEKRDDDVHYMLKKHKGYPFFVAIDFQRGKTHPRLEELIDEHVEGLRTGLDIDEADWQGLRFKYASVLLRYRDSADGAGGQDDKWPVMIEHVLPRVRGLLIGSEGNMSQGKSGNQLGALRFAEGHLLQMMDANMGCYAGEAFKVPFVLQRFYKKANEVAEGENHRLSLCARIYGFREHIFTRSHGLVGKIMADAEWTFGTLVQRLLEFLNVRMHYGHPDFMDGFWASNRGSVSKASPHINLSEDIFAGLNVSTRNERSLHTDILEWEKGREVQFVAGSGFFWKISSGSVGLMRTRDLRVLCSRASIMQSVALYFATAAWYMHNLMVDWATELYVMIFIVLSLASKSLNSLGVLGSALAVEWFLTPAISSTLPAMVGFGVEYGPWWLITNYLPSVPASMLYFIFINKSMASSVRQTLWANTAEYVNTGRPHANKSYTMLQAFQAFRVSHYNPAVKLLYLVFVYRLSNEGGALPMVMVTGTAVAWILAPVLFRPPTASVSEQFMELAEFIWKVPSSSKHFLPGKAACLYDAALEQELKLARRGVVLRMFVMLSLLCLYTFMTVSTILEQIPAPFFAWAATFCVKRLSGMGRTGVVYMGSQLVLPLVICFAWVFIENFNLASLLIAMILFIHIMETVKVFVWVLTRLFLFLVPDAAAVAAYDRIVQILFDYSLSYQLEVYGAVAVLVAQALVESLLSLLDSPRLRCCSKTIALPRLRTWMLLNKTVAHGCVETIYGEAPSKAAARRAEEAPGAEVVTSI